MDLTYRIPTKEDYPRVMEAFYHQFIQGKNCHAKVFNHFNAQKKNILQRNQGANQEVVIQMDFLSH